jgi:hypothetical protein
MIPVLNIDMYSRVPFLSYEIQGQQAVYKLVTAVTLGESLRCFTMAGYTYVRPGLPTLAIMTHDQEI